VGGANVKNPDFQHVSTQECAPQDASKCRSKQIEAKKPLKSTIIVGFAAADPNATGPYLYTHAHHQHHNDDNGDDNAAAMNESSPPSTASSSDEGATSTSKSALQDNIDRKGKNAYYFAHAHKATGPKWDGKPEPKLLSKQSSDGLGASSKTSTSFDVNKSNLTKYSFCDDGPKVKLYIDLEGVGEKCNEGDVTLENSSRSLSLVVQNFKIDEPQTLCFARLSADITDATFRVKAHRIVVTLVKADPEQEWHTINDKGSPDHEVV
jgi:hypothetical protein